MQLGTFLPHRTRAEGTGRTPWPLYPNYPMQLACMGVWTFASDTLLHTFCQVDAKCGTYLQDVYVNTRSSSDGSSSTNQGNLVLFAIDDEALQVQNLRRVEATLAKSSLGK